MILDDIAPDAEALGCAAELAQTRVIARKDTNADRQLAIFGEARKGGARAKEALAAVVDWMADAMAGKTLPGPVRSS
ncbi:hypothetical protein [Sphingomonas bacterium]|uniref:hypothetical protein n=1 Tax=Sphingomonas bacterium TaxID=1895847 RepID=UPI001576ED26|nr:hypothetical protein [Sphingomonas bacterium]